MVRMGVESYLGVPLRDADGQTLGHLAVFDDRPDARRAAAAVHLPHLRRPRRGRAGAAAVRAAAPRERAALPRPLRRGADRATSTRTPRSRFVSANRAALRDPGHPARGGGRHGRRCRCVAPTRRDMQKRIHEALAARCSAGQGTCRASSSNCAAKTTASRSGCSGGRRPEPDGKHTRTMFVDITERVLMEQREGPARAAEPVPPGGDQERPQLRGDRRPEPARWSTVLENVGRVRRPTRRCSSSARPARARS